MKIRFQADADFNQIILLATVRRESSIDFQTAEAAGLSRLQDRDVLGLAAREGRILVTHDQKTMPRHFAEFITTETSPGLLVVPQHLTVADVTEDLLLIWSTTEPEEWTNRISFLPL
jgi:predicted nuclease of predicted toxin-antitoxin system